MMRRNIQTEDGATRKIDMKKLISITLAAGLGLTHL
jgi:hypothetical protein